MSDVSQTELKHKNRWIFLFVAGVGLLAFYCILMLNAKYDELSRYPYTDQKSRQLIREHLNEQEIDYIIEYSIAPNMFVAYIQEEGFNIYHASEYKRLSEYAWQEPPAHIVQMVEETIDIMSVDTLIEYLGGYRYDELHDYLVFGDRYAAGTPLLMGAQAVDTYVDEKVTLGIRKPAYLVRLDTEKIPAEREGILVDPRISADLEAMCAAAAEKQAVQRPVPAWSSRTGIFPMTNRKPAMKRMKACRILATASISSAWRLISAFRGCCRVISGIRCSTSG